MDWTAILAAAKAALVSLEGVALQQGEELLQTFESALPAIQKGISSAEPFVVSAFNLLTNRQTGTPAEQWAIQKSLMQAQIADVDAVVAADEQAQPTGGGDAA